MSLWNRIVRASFDQPGNPFSRIGAFLFFIGFGVGGALVLWSICLKPWLKTNAASGWEAVEGKLNSIDVSRDGDSEKVETSYDYVYLGEEFSGHRFQFGGAARNFATDMLDESIANYEREKPITIWVNPEAPEESVIERHFHWTNFLGLFFSVPFLTGRLLGVRLGHFQRSAPPSFDGSEGALGGQS